MVILGDILSHKKDTYQAIECYDKAIRFSNKKMTVVRANVEKAKLLGRLENKSEETITIYQHLCELDPDNPDIHSSFGEFLYWQRMYKEAETEYKLCLALDPGNDYVIRNLAGILARQNGRDEESESLFINALNINDNNYKTHNQYGNFLSWRNRYDEALVHYEKSLSIREDPEVRKKIDEIKSKTNKPETD